MVNIVIIYKRFNCVLEIMKNNLQFKSNKDYCNRILLFKQVIPHTFVRKSIIRNTC